MDRCETCVYRMKYPKETRERLFGDVTPHDSYVSCHQYSTEDDETGDDVPSDVCCAGFYAKEPYANPLMRISHLCRVVEFVDDDGEPVACPIPQGVHMTGYAAIVAKARRGREHA